MPAYWLAYVRDPRCSFLDSRRFDNRDADGVFMADYHTKPRNVLFDIHRFDFLRLTKAVFDMHVAFKTYPVKDQSEYFTGA